MIHPDRSEASGGGGEPVALRLSATARAAPGGAVGDAAAVAWRKRVEEVEGVERHVEDVPKASCWPPSRAGPGLAHRAEGGERRAHRIPVYKRQSRQNSVRQSLGSGAG